MENRNDLLTKQQLADALSVSVAEVSAMVRLQKKLHEKYSSILSYIALLNAEIARRSAKLEEMRKKKTEEKKKPQNDRLDGLNFQFVIIDNHNSLVLWMRR